MEIFSPIFSRQSLKRNHFQTLLSFLIHRADGRHRSFINTPRETPPYLHSIPHQLPAFPVHSPAAHTPRNSPSSTRFRPLRTARIYPPFTRPPSPKKSQKTPRKGTKKGRPAPNVTSPFNCRSTSTSQCNINVTQCNASFSSPRFPSILLTCYPSTGKAAFSHLPQRYASFPPP